jgi:dihydrofolate synthase/folylpolyglutamate synthase
MDHMHWLGSTLQDIAREKAGIIKPGIPIVTAVQRPEALEVLRIKARELNAPFHQITQMEVDHHFIRNLNLQLKGSHQRWNAALCVKVTECLQADFPTTEASLRAGLESTKLDARFQIVVLGNGSRLVIDGAHNADSFEATIRTMHREFPDRTWTLILDIMEDKDWRRVTELAAKNAAKIILLKTSSSRSAQPEQLQKRIHEIEPNLECVIAKEPVDALKRCGNDPLKLAAGSFYLAGDILAHLRNTGHVLAEEQPLNDWNASNSNEGRGSRVEGRTMDSWVQGP